VLLTLGVTTATASASVHATTAAPDHRPAAPLTRRELEVLLHIIKRVVRDWPDHAHVAETASRHRGGWAGYPVLHTAARDLLAARDRLRTRLGEELRPDHNAGG
jgi:hypothetical protein